MGKDIKKKEDKPKKNDFKSFLKKRAPIYLALIAMLVVFVIPEMTKGTLEKSFPEFSDKDQQRAVDILMKYDGPNNDGLTVMEALENKINEEYPGEKIFDHKKTVVDLTVSNINADEYKVNFYFKSHKGETNYGWNVNLETEEIVPNNPEGKYIVELVNYYD